MLQRAYTYVPGGEAYGDVSIQDDAPSQNSNELHAAVMGTPQVTSEASERFKPIILKK